MSIRCIGLMVLQSLCYFGDEAALSACSHEAQWENCSNQLFSGTHTHESLSVQSAAAGSESYQCAHQINQQQPASLFNASSIIPIQPAGMTNFFMYGDSFNQVTQGSPNPHHHHQQQPSADISDCFSSCLAKPMQTRLRDPSNDPHIFQG